MIDGPDNLPPMGNLPLPELLERVLTLTDEAKGVRQTRSAVTDSVSDRLVEIRDLDHRESMILGALRHTVASPLSRMKAEKYLRESGLGSINRSAGLLKTALLVLVVLGSSLSVGSGFPNEVPTMPTKPQASTLVQAREALKKLDWKRAEALYVKAYGAGDRPEECLFRTAECRYNLKDYAGALEAVVDLEVVSGGRDANAPMVRGWIARDRGDKAKARDWFGESLNRGNPKARTLLEALN